MRMTQSEQNDLLRMLIHLFSFNKTDNGRNAIIRRIKGIAQAVIEEPIEEFASPKRNPRRKVGQ